MLKRHFTLHGSDGKTYILAEIEGEGHNAAGAGDDYFSFVGAVPPAGVTLSVASCTDSHGVNYADLSADAPAHVNNAPTFDNAPANGVIHIDENTKAVIDLNASDADGDTLTYSITGGADKAFFEINAHTGELSFKNAPDFENPQDVSGNNNVYDVTVTVSDGNGGRKPPKRCGSKSRTLTKAQAASLSVSLSKPKTWTCNQMKCAVWLASLRRSAGAHLPPWWSGRSDDNVQR